MSFEGLDEEIQATTENKVVSIGEGQPKRLPFHVWTVNGQDHKMKLTTQMTSALEKKYNTNVLNLVAQDGLPPLVVMLTIVQAAIDPWEHGTTFEKVSKMYDMWCEEDDGNQVDLLSKVIMPTMVVSGFFTKRQGESIMNSLQTEDELL